MLHRSRLAAILGGLLLSPLALVLLGSAALATHDPDVPVQSTYTPPPPPVDAGTAGMPTSALLAVLAGAMLIAFATARITLAIDRTRRPRPVIGAVETADGAIFDLTRPTVDILE